MRIPLWPDVLLLAQSPAPSGPDLGWVNILYYAGVAGVVIILMIVGLLVPGRSLTREIERGDKLEAAWLKERELREKDQEIIRSFTEKADLTNKLLTDLKSTRSRRT